jgi:hypothetical protein
MLRFFTALALAGFILNLVWETAQMGAYAQAVRLPWHYSVVRHMLPTLGDVVVTFVLYGMGALAARRLRWGFDGGWQVYATMAVLGAAAAMAIESLALSSGRWGYNERMPLVPVLNVGSLPVLQLALTTPLSVWIAGWWYRRRTGR